MFRSSREAVAKALEKAACSKVDFDYEDENSDLEEEVSEEEYQKKAGVKDFIENDTGENFSDDEYDLHSFTNRKSKQKGERDKPILRSLSSLSTCSSSSRVRDGIRNGPLDNHVKKMSAFAECGGDNFEDLEGDIDNDIKNEGRKSKKKKRKNENTSSNSPAPRSAKKKRKKSLMSNLRNEFINKIQNQNLEDSHNFDKDEQINEIPANNKIINNNKTITKNYPMSPKSSDQKCDDSVLPVNRNLQHESTADTSRVTSKNDAIPDAPLADIEIMNKQLMEEAGSFWQAGSAVSLNSSAEDISCSDQKIVHQTDSLQNCSDSLLGCKFDNKDFIWFYVIDFWEGDAQSNDRTVLFGKAQDLSRADRSLVSCSVRISLNKSTVLFRIKDQKSITDPKLPPMELISEIALIAKKLNHSNPEMKIVKRAFCLFKHEEIPPNTPEFYVKYKYNSSEKHITDNLHSGIHYSHCFGAQTPTAEQIIRQRKLYGPSWILLENPKIISSENEKITFCSFELKIGSQKNIHSAQHNAKLFQSVKEITIAKIKQTESINKNKNVNINNNINNNNNNNISSPKSSSSKLCFEFTTVPLTLLSISISSAAALDSTTCGSIFACSLTGVTNYIDSSSLESQMTSKESNENRCVPISEIVLRPFTLSKDDKPTWSAEYQNLITASNYGLAADEKGLLMSLCSLISKYDPDVILAHNLFGSVIDTLAARLAVHKVMSWHKLSRLKRPRLPLDPKQVSIWRGFFKCQKIFAGRLIVDTYIQAKELMGSRIEYSLESLYEELKIVPDKNNNTTQNNNNNSTCPKLLPEAVIPQLVSILNSSNCSNSSTGSSLAPFLGTMSPEVQLTFKQVQSVYGQMTPQSLTLLLTQTYRLRSQLPLLVADKVRVLALTRELSQICGNVWNRSLANQRAERNEFLLLHKFHEAKYICPDPLQNFGQKGKRKGNLLNGEEDNEEANDVEKRSKSAGPKYSGGLVFEPLSGFYNTFILYLDFNSLYPSIIQQFQLCFTNRAAFPNEADDKTADNIIDEENEEIKNNSNDYLLPTILQELVSKRKEARQQLATTSQSEIRSILDIKQKALKLVANSLYGTLGFSQSRFHAEIIASTITAYGRQIIARTKSKTESFGLKVIYGDTDSIMVDSGIPVTDNVTDANKAVQLARQIMNIVNKKKHLELDLECLFKKMLLLKKKRYAAMKINVPSISVPLTPFQLHGSSLEKKGIDIVRRDWCPLTCRIGNKLLEIIFDNKLSDEDEVAEAVERTLKAVASDIENKKISNLEYVISKALSRLPHLYQNPAQHPHVQVALRMARNRPGSIFADMVIPYVICKSETETNWAARAYHIAEVESSSELDVDVEWYKRQQLLPPLQRLLEYVQGFDQDRIASALGLNLDKTTSGLRSARDRSSFSYSSMVTWSRVEESLNIHERFKLVASIPSAAIPTAQSLIDNTFQKTRKYLSDKYTSCLLCGCLVSCLTSLMFNGRCRDQCRKPPESSLSSSLSLSSEQTDVSSSSSLNIKTEEYWSTLMADVFEFMISNPQNSILCSNSDCGSFGDSIGPLHTKGSSGIDGQEMINLNDENNNIEDYAKQKEEIGCLKCSTSEFCLQILDLDHFKMFWRTFEPSKDIDGMKTDEFDSSTSVKRTDERQNDNIRMLRLAVAKFSSTMRLEKKRKNKQPKYFSLRRLSLCY